MKTLFIITSLSLVGLSFMMSPSSIGKTSVFNDSFIENCSDDGALVASSNFVVGSGCKVCLMTCNPKMPNAESLEQFERLKVLSGYDSNDFTQFDSN